MTRIRDLRVIDKERLHDLWNQVVIATKLFLSGFEAIGRDSVYHVVLRQLESLLERLQRDRVAQAENDIRKCLEPYRLL